MQISGRLWWPSTVAIAASLLVAGPFQVLANGHTVEASWTDYNSEEKSGPAETEAMEVRDVDLKPDRVDSSATTGGAGVSIDSGIEWVRIPGGTFLMGSNSGESDEMPVHTVTVPAFEMAKTEVTVAQYRKCVEAGACSDYHLTGYEWSGHAFTPSDHCNWGVSGRESNPMNCVDWDQASAYAKWVGGRLPSEAEWEYAARGGTTGDRHGDLDSVAWYDRNSGDGTHPVNQKQANMFGMADMLGNVWEWCRDWYHHSYEGAPSNGSAWESPTATNRVSRGGAWYNPAIYVRAANRCNGTPEYRHFRFGFRPARSVP